MEDIGGSIKFEYDVLGRELSSMKVGGRIRRLCRPADADAFCAAVGYLNGEGERFAVLGNCSNVVFSSAGYDGTVVLTSGLTSLYLKDGIIYAGAGISLSALASFAAAEGFTGLEFAYGIPGTVGGGVYMNAGAYGGELKDVLVSVDCVDGSGRRFSLASEEAKLSYRHSIFAEKPLYILGAELALKAGDKTAVLAKMAENMAKRREKQPLEYPSCGSTFKRPQGHFAGALIEQAGLKGFAVGGAQVSEKHAGFVINRGNATGDDVKALIEYVIKTVYEKTGVRLEPEVELY